MENFKEISTIEACDINGGGSVQSGVIGWAVGKVLDAAWPTVRDYCMSHSAKEYTGPEGYYYGHSHGPSKW